ncbi:MAG: hypothetical protein K2X81_15695 [Candidatus Obscuribacterales bacterium]|nr:hypothetical protein [Candidatus Obscuribacterales bacterium]
MDLPSDKKNEGKAPEPTEGTHDNLSEFRATKPPSVKDFADKLINDFSKIDADGNGYITQGEIEKRMADPLVKGQDAAGLAALRLAADAIDNLTWDWSTSDGFTKKDLLALRDKSQNNPADATVKAIDTQLKDAASGIPEQGAVLFGKDGGGIRPEAVRQGVGIADCYLMASLASIAATNPENIRSMIKQIDQDHFQVTFPGAPNEPIKISRPTDSEFAAFAHASENGIWPSLIEKAFGQYVANHQSNAQAMLGHALEHQGSPLQTLLLDGGTSSGFFMEMLTGKSSSHVNLKDADAKTLIGNIKESLDAKLPVTTCMELNNKHASEIGLNAGALGLESLGYTGGVDGTAHLFSILGVNPEKGTITVRDPYGKMEPRNSYGNAKTTHSPGVFEMSAAEFKKTFSLVSFTNNSSSRSNGGVIFSANFKRFAK